MQVVYDTAVNAALDFAVSQSSAFPKMPENRNLPLLSDDTERVNNRTNLVRRQLMISQ